MTCYCGDLAEGERLLAPLRSFGSPMVDAIQPMPFPVMQTLFDAAVPDGNQNYWKSTFLRELTDEAIDVIVSHANQATSPLTAVLVEQYGGAASRVPARRTRRSHSATRVRPRHPHAVGGRRRTPSAAHRWTRAFADAMAPFRSGDYLLNFLGEENDDTIKAAFGTELRAPASR